VFISASEDKTLDFIEGKIARATMLPRIHGEVVVIVLSSSSSLLSFHLSWLEDKTIVCGFQFDWPEVFIFYDNQFLLMFIYKFKVKYSFNETFTY